MMFQFNEPCLHRMVLDDTSFMCFADGMRRNGIYINAHIDRRTDGLLNILITRFNKSNGERNNESNRNEVSERNSPADD